MIRKIAVPVMADRPYRAEFGAIYHEDVTGFLFQVLPPEHAPKVADALNRAEAPAAPDSPSVEEVVAVLRAFQETFDHDDFGRPERVNLAKFCAALLDASDIIAKLEGNQ